MMLQRHTCTYPSPSDHVVLDDLLRAFRVGGAVHERLIPVRVIVSHDRLASVPPVIAIQVVRAAVTSRAPDRRVAQRGRVAQAPHAVATQVGHVSA